MSIVVTHGIAPFLECSSKGDTRFSAFYARPACLKGRSIEEAYQAMKVLADGRTNLSWPQAKRRKAVNQAECIEAYTGWWLDWVLEQELFPVLYAASGLSDRFGQKGRVCQATVLWVLRNA